MSLNNQLSISFILVSLLLSISSLTYADEYSFGVVPQFEARKLYRIWKPILNILEQKTGHHFNLIGTESIPEFEHQFMQGRYDFAYMNPWHSLIAFEQQGYLPLVHDGKRKLQGILVVRQDSKITELSQLQGKTVAFPAPNTLEASLLTRAELTTLHHLTVHPRYVGTHSSAYLNVALNQAAAAGGVSRTLQQQPPILRNLLKILYKTRVIPPHPVSAHPRVPEQVRIQVTQAFLAMANNSEQQKLLTQIPMQHPVIASVSDYQVLKKLGLDNFYVKP